MRFERFENELNAWDALHLRPEPAKSVFADRGLQPISFIRHVTDEGVSAYVTLAPIDKDEARREFVDGLVILGYGQGSRCALSSATAPPNRAGVAKFGNGRVATWALGLPPGWNDIRPVWFSWPAEHGQTYRLESAEISFDAMKALAEAVAMCESQA